MARPKKTVFTDQLEFMEACDQVPSLDIAETYGRLIIEEFQEFIDANNDGNAIEMIDAALDLMYVAIGFMHSLGLEPQELWDEVHRSNMAKVDPATGKVKRREDGKILKPEGWQPPNLKDLVSKQLSRRIDRLAKEAQAEIARESREIKASKMLTGKQAARLLGVADATLAQWRSNAFKQRYPNAKTLPYVKVGHRVRYQKSDIDKFIKEQRSV